MTNLEKQEILDFLKSLDIDNLCISDFITIDDIDDSISFDSITDRIAEQGGFDVEVIYYHSAMKYLTEKDPSLMCSLELASYMGFQIDNLNSETLASLLASENLRNDWEELRVDIESFLVDYTY